MILSTLHRMLATRPLLELDALMDGRATVGSCQERNIDGADEAKAGAIRATLLRPIVGPACPRIRVELGLVHSARAGGHSFAGHGAAQGGEAELGHTSEAAPCRARAPGM